MPELQSTQQNDNFNNDNQIVQEQSPNSIPFTVASILFLGFFTFTLIIISLITGITSLINIPIPVTYFLFCISSVFCGFIVNHAMKKLNAKTSTNVLFGITIPFFPVLVVSLFYTIINTLSKQLRTFSSGDIQITGTFDFITNIIGSNLASPLITMILIYSFFNLFIIIKIIKTKKYYTFLLYLLIPLLIFVSWMISSILTNTILTFTPI
jgi:hypothetical protein